MSSNVLGNKDINAPIMSEQDQVLRTKDIKSMEYHREVLKSKMEERYASLLLSLLSLSLIVHFELTSSTSCSSSKQYVSPSDNIMSPCSAKLNALRNKHASKFVSHMDTQPLSSPTCIYMNANLPSSSRAKPKSLFAQASAKKLQGESALGATPARP